MSSQAPFTTPAPPPAPHGGAMDPNELRLRQARTQQTTVSSAHSTNGPGTVATENPPHGGDMDPNEVRLRLARLQQTSGSSSPASSVPDPNIAVASRGGVQMQHAEIQSAQYGSSSHLINTPSPPPLGYNMYQNTQSPQSSHSGQYFAAQHGNQPSNPSQAPQSPQGAFPGQYSPAQHGHQLSSPGQTQQSPHIAYSGQYFPTQVGNQPSNPTQAQQPPHSSYSGLPNDVGYRQR